MTEVVRDAMANLKNQLEGIYRERLYGLYLYGSCARGDQSLGSDIDVLVVLDRVSDYGAEINRTSEAIASRSLHHGVSLSRVFVTQEAWQEVREGFLSRVRQEAIAA